ncbi:MAG: hypothetical protein SPI12_00515 [Actinomycetaceae bacterium]|nr:hypothetical protein [Actinomycetaceae bacterium]MDY6082335.1 hypothetical protein [Actinomycetaceae bacterium]
MKPPDYQRVLHLGNPASTATLLSVAARHTGRSWKVLPLATTPHIHMVDPVLQRIARAARGAIWEAQFAAHKITRPKIHLHSAMATPHVGWALGDYALHLHGTDIRTRLYEESYHQRIVDAVTHARVVFYSTPDLAQHALPIRKDAILAPVPVTMKRTRAKNPLGSGRTYVFFTSRWEDVKGGYTQLEAARALRSLLPAHVELIGLDWGPLAAEAWQVGIQLVPKQPYPSFRALVRDAQLCIGQTAGIMSASELDALAEGTPIVAPLNPQWYAADHPSLHNVPVLGGTNLDGRDAEGIAHLAAEHLGEPLPAAASSWLKANHSPEACLDIVLGGYRSHQW